MKKCTVIGAGILGATTAYKLAKSGMDVTIIDKPDRGQATSAAAGIISPWLSQRRNKAWYHLATNGARYYPKLVEELKEDGEESIGYARVGALNIQSTPEKLQKTYERGMKQLEKLPEIGELSIIKSEEIKKMFPLISDDYQAIHVSGAARVDGLHLRKSLLNAAEKHGAIIKYGQAVLKSIDNEAFVYLDGQKVPSDIIICTTGAWMSETLKPLGVNFKATPQRGQILHFKHHNFDTSTWPVLMPPNNLSIVPFADRLIIGATHENDVGFDLSVTAGGIHDILTKALDIIPNLTDWTLLESRVGFRPYTPESLPVVGAIPDYKNVYAANGLGASGLTTGPFVGDQLVKLILNDKLNINLEDYKINVAIDA